MVAYDGVQKPLLQFNRSTCDFTGFSDDGHWSEVTASSNVVQQFAGGGFHVTIRDTLSPRLAGSNPLAASPWTAMSTVERCPDAAYTIADDVGTYSIW